MSLYVRRTIPIALLGITGILMVVDQALVDPTIAAAATVLQDWSIIVAGVALCLGGANLVVIHGQIVKKRTRGRWIYSLLLFAAMGAYVVVGLGLSTFSVQYRWLFDVILFPLGQVMFSILAFYMFSAAVRSMQARSWEATIFLVCAVLVLIGNIPSLILISPQLGAIGPWLTDVPTKGIFRALVITAAVGGIILGVRTLIGGQTEYLGRG